MNSKINTEILYYTGYTLQHFLNQFETLLNEYEHGKIKNEDSEEQIIKYNIEVLYNLIRITNNYLNLKPYEIKIICYKLFTD